MSARTGSHALHFRIQGTRVERLVELFQEPPKLPVDPQPSWMGYSSGTWQGDTLVVQTIGLNDRSSLDAIHHPHSESMRMIERFRRRDFGHMEIEMTIEDSKYLTRPVTVKIAFRLIPDSDVLEFVCAENERDVVHLSQ